MLSAFSFGKIIKTFLPGMILLTGLILLIDVTLQILFPDLDQMPVKTVIAFSNFTTLATIAAPVSVLLGILLNTLLWQTLIDKLRSKWQAKDVPIVATCFEQLDAFARNHFSDICQDEKIKSLLKAYPVSRRYFYLPIVELEHLNYLWESYFAWFEFQINIMVALSILFASMLISAIFYAIKFDVHQFSNPFLLFLFAGTVVTFFVVFAKSLLKAAQKNLERFDRGLTSLIIGSLTFHTKKED